MPERCERCDLLEHELARVLDVDQEIARWVTSHPRATPAQAWRAGWFRAWSIAQRHLRDWRQRWLNQSREISLLRSRLGVLLQDISRRDDSG